MTQNLSRRRMLFIWLLASMKGILFWIVMSIRKIRRKLWRNFSSHFCFVTKVSSRSLKLSLLELIVFSRPLRSCIAYLNFKLNSVSLARFANCERLIIVTSCLSNRMYSCHQSRYYVSFSKCVCFVKLNHNLAILVNFS